MCMHMPLASPCTDVYAGVSARSVSHGGAYPKHLKHQHALSHTIINGGGREGGGRLGKDSTGLHFSRILFRRISGNDCASESHPPSPFIPPCMHSLWYIHTHPDNIQSVRAFRTQRERNRGREGGREQERERGGGSEKEREREDACVLLVL